MPTDAPRPQRRPLLAWAGELALKLIGFFVILEPIWMLLPFAGFLYGSVLRIQTLNQNPQTAWLAHFVFPVLTLGLVGPILVVLGFLVFLVGAGQIYTAKLRRSGLVTGGLYRFVRHPQYIALTLFGLGLLLTWGRAIMFIAFFLMMFLYYYLAKHEERLCLRLFGEAYERYRQRTSFVVPGDKLLRPMGARLARLRLPAPIRVGGAFLVTMALCLGLMWLIQTVSAAARTVPYSVATVALGPVDQEAVRAEIVAREVAGVPFVQRGRLAVVRGPYRNASAGGFAERAALRLRKSKALKDFLSFLDEPEGDVAIAFCGPYAKPKTPGRPGMHAGGGPAGRGPAPDPHGPHRVRMILMRCTLAPGASIGQAFADRSKRTIRGACIAPVNLAREDDLVEGKLFRPGPGFPGEQKWSFFLKQLELRRAQRSSQAAAPMAIVPGRAATGSLVLVHAPILRTRLDPAFAQEILDRLAGSARFRQQLRDRAVGGPVVAMAFPRPGPNWYREHHGKPQISLFVMLARLTQGDSPDDLFHRDRRVLESAFIANMDFKIERPQDCVDAMFTTIGRRRDLEERWRFFLSGVGGLRIHHH